MRLSSNSLWIVGSFAWILSFIFQITNQPGNTSILLGGVQALSSINSGSSSTVSSPPKVLSLTQRMFERTSLTPTTGGAGGTVTYEAFLRAEEQWNRLKQQSDALSTSPPFLFVTDDGATGTQQGWSKLRKQQEQQKQQLDGKVPLDYDIAVCGGTLGIFFATALALRGHKVVVVEGGKLQGRVQEWNISRKELEELVQLGVLTQEDVEAVITTEFPSCRSGFKNREVTPLQGGYFENGIGFETTTPNVLNLGVSPVELLERVKQRFLSLGGTIREQTRLQGVVVSESVGTALDLGDEQEPITASLLLDCMGNASPISRQQRHGMKPDGICAVVGSCASGYDAASNLIGDIIYTNTEIQDKGENGKLQYFWEAFPVGIGRNGMAPGTSTTKTTYMFTYMDAHEKRPSLEMLMDDYWKLLPEYQPSIQDPERDLDVHQILFAYFPTYRDSPVQPQWSRVLAVGDASGIQSPLSFGGFGALTRHLHRITDAVSEALEHSLLTQQDLAEINAYTPNLSAAWMFQKAMSVRMGQSVNPQFINRLLANNFDIMDQMGPRTIVPFLQDVIRVDGLLGSLARSFVSDPTFMPEIVFHVGIPSLVDWLGHVGMMMIYTGLHNTVTPVLMPLVDGLAKDPRVKFQWKRRMEAWKFGSGMDYILPEDEE